MAANDLGAHAIRYRPDIDGLRAIAVTAVVLFHAGIFPFGSGFVGVDIFFVISGYLIGGIVYRDTVRQCFSFTSFYARRARRILPALLLVALTSSLLGCLVLSPDELRRLGSSVTYALFGVANIHFWMVTSYFTPDAHLDAFLMTWSLGVEEQFYLFLPVLLLIIRRLAPRAAFPSIAGLSALSLAVSMVLVAKAPGAAFYLLPSRAWELGVGVALAIWEFDGHRPIPPRMANLTGVVGIVAVLLSVVVFDERTLFPGLAAMLPVFGAAFILVSETSIVNQRLLAARPMVGIGLISYSWYLWHWPLIALAWVCSAEPPSRLALSAIAFISFGLAYLSWRFVERPFRRGGLSARVTLTRYATALIACALLPIWLRLGHGLPQRVDPRVAQIDALAAISRDGCLADYGDARPDQSAACVSTDARPRIALLGDSHAAALGEALREAAAAAGYGFEQFTESSCPPLDGVTRAFPQHPGHARQCADYNRRAIDLVRADPMVRTVILAGFWDTVSETSGDAYINDDLEGDRLSSDDTFRSGIIRTEQDFLGVGKMVIAVGDVPRFTFDPVRKSIADLMPIRKFVQHLVSPNFATDEGLAAWRFVKPANGAASLSVEGSVSSVPHARFVALSKKLCGSVGCRFGDGRSVFYFDAQHLSLPGARYVVTSAPELLGLGRPGVLAAAPP